MKKEDAINWFGGRKKLSEALGVVPTAVTQWGPVVPLISAMRLEEISFGHLKVDRSLYDYRGRPNREAA